MAESERKKQYNLKYHKETYDIIGFKIPKGTKTILQSIATEKNASIKEIIVEALEYYYNIDLTTKPARKKTETNTSEK